MHNFNLLSPQRGVTLIELMVALALGITVIMGVTQGLVSLTNSSRVQIKNAELQESGDAALSYISFRLRNALSTPCERFAKLKPTNVKVHNLAGEISYNDDKGNNKKENITGADSLKTMIEGLGVKVAQETVKGKKSDRLTIVGTGQRYFIGSDINFNSNIITINSPVDFTATGNKTLYSLTNCKNMDVFRAKPNFGSMVTRLEMREGSTSKSLIKKSYTVTDSSMIAPVDVSEIFVDSQGRLMSKSLFLRSPGPLMDNVDLMRVLFSVDKDGDGMADQYITASQLNTTPSNELGNVLSADIYLLVRLPDKEGLFPAEQTFYLPGTDTDITSNFMEAIKYDDKIPRKVFTRSVVLRNNAITL